MISQPLLSDNVFEQQIKKFKNGVYFRVKNNANESIYCIVRSTEYPVDFTIKPKEYSYWYPKPKSKYTVRCE